ncbi:NAD-dependent malic enzyme [Pantoea stewartii]|uniref:NAD-dependent malic enzyme n=1 Tax=Pantoea stewartii TaxID=66269 RepID=UPI00197CC45B|nr:NAD-dependent malic enzyme [Pantoea stewartii]
MAPEKTGTDLLSNGVLNKGTAFTQAEREAFRLEGLLPPGPEDIENQMQRVMKHLERKDDMLEQYIYLQGLEERNQTLFYRTVMSDPMRFIPVIYDPVVADACLAYGHIFRRPRGMYITRDMKGRMAEVLRNWPVKDVRFICVSTGGRILGLGDIGANGMPIPVGKLQLYTACAAVPPQVLLPVMFDVGTTNTGLIDDPLYLGIRQQPPEQEEMDALVDEFVRAVQEVFPECCLHFEDWKGTDALRYLERYREKALCYNDDIQGTASIALAGIVAALETLGQTVSEQRILFLGAGSAGLGIAGLIGTEMRKSGLSADEARQRIRMMDINGLLTRDRADLSREQRDYACDEAGSHDLEEYVKRFRPTILVGVSTCQGAFTEGVVKAMCENTPRPVIFALSNPTSKAECTAEQAYRWSDGKALFAAGVQFPEVHLNGKTLYPGQANNFYIFPAVGLATYAARPRLLTDECFVVAAHATAEQVTLEMRRKGLLYPGQADVLQTEINTAVAVAEHMFDSGLARAERPADIRLWIESKLYTPSYSSKP